MWEIRRIEAKLRELLLDEFGPAKGESLYALYTRARDKIVSQVAPQIAGVEPHLTDHGPDHIAEVLDNAYALLGETAFEGAGGLTAVDAYALCISILFHDVGNVFGRVGHEKRIARVYDWVREGEQPPKQEKFIVVRAAGAHSGFTDGGSRDTIESVPDTWPLEGKKVQLREIAALIRFADELAEGPQRTSLFMQEVVGIPDASAVYHQYANVTDVHIGRGEGRIALTYEFKIDTQSAPAEEIVAGFRQMLEFVYGRVVKLDQERQYARFFSKHLSPFRLTTVQFNFWIDGELRGLDLEPLILSDKRVPGTNAPPLHEMNAAYALDAICDQLRQLLETEVSDA